MDYYNKHFQGIFWIPKNESNKIMATLFIDFEGCVEIHSMQPLSENTNEHVFASGFNKLEIVFGYIICSETSNTYSIKLYDVWKTNSSLSTLSSNKYESKKSFITKYHDSDISSLNYDIIMMGSSFICDWVTLTGFKQNSNNHKKFTINQSYEQPEAIDLFKDKNYHIYMFFRASFRNSRFRKSSITEEVFINIKLEQGLPIPELIKIKTMVERLLNVLLFIPFYSVNLEFRLGKGNSYKSLKKFAETQPTLGDKIEFDTFLKNSQTIFKNWFSKQESLDLAVTNFFSVYGQKGVLEENKFLTYISILENYHKNTTRKKENLKIIIELLLNQSSIKSNITNIDAYSIQLKITRNYYAHLEEKHEENALDLDEVILANEILEYVIREIFLKEVGITEVKPSHLKVNN